MWEYAALFDVPGNRTELERAMLDEEWWAKTGCSLRVGQMGYRTATTKAGDTLVAEIYPIWGREQERGARAKKKNLTPARVQAYNLSRAKFRLELLLDENFTAEDQSVTLTYTDAPDWEQARKDTKNFIARIRRERKKRGLPELKYVYSLEQERDGRKKNLHCHIVMSGGIQREEVERIWQKGSKARGYANCDQLQPDKEGLRKLAFYIYEQSRGSEREKGQRHYSCSKNLREPKVRTSNSKVSAAKVRRMALDFNSTAKGIMEKIYPGYEFVRGLKYQEDESGTWSESSVRFSDYTSGVYIRVMMRRIKGGKRNGTM